ncbi:MAG: carboxysome shell carbonic anhydrase [Rhodocyclaceae bacterium]|nr:carboxysome shell carbonic anhydrase [Rhodocyclaceae bacterium]
MVNTRKRLAAMRQAGYGTTDAGADIANPACVIGPGQRCAHALVDAELNRRLDEYEARVRARFAAIVPVLRQISAQEHAEDFVWRAQELARERLGYELPPALLEHAWVTGLDMSALHADAIFKSFAECVSRADADQAPWRECMRLDADFFRACGYHTIDITPCADGRLQGLLPFVLRLAPSDVVSVKAYAGAVLDVETDMADWTQRELERLSGGMTGCESANYLKIAVYHYSSSCPTDQGCAAHGSSDVKAVSCALGRLEELRAAIENTFGAGAAPDVLLIGVDTDIDAIRIHAPDAHGSISAARYIDNASLYRETLGLDAETGRARIAAAVTASGSAPGMQTLIAHLLEANLSQIEYVIQHHAGRYAVIGHDENFIVAGEAVSEMQLRNMYYFAHLDTIEEGAPDMDVGVKIFTGLNLRRGLAVPVLVHFRYNSRVPGTRDRAAARCRRVKAAIAARYPDLTAHGMIHCVMAVTDSQGTERAAFIAADTVVDGH